MYKKLLPLVVLLVGVGVGMMGQPRTGLLPNETVLLYADEFTDEADPVRAKKIVAAGFEMAVDNEITEGEAISESGNIGQISKDARFDLYFPERPNGQMVVVCPGGGYLYVSSYNEGSYVAEWMLERGITVAVVKYRMPNHHHNVPLEDVQNTFRYCRAHAEEWGVRDIGVIGFSAGGHLAVTASVMYSDALTRPDFSIFIYPVVTMEDGITHSITREQLVGSSEEEMERYSLENRTAKDNPPAFIALCNDDDAVVPENSIRLYRALNANGVPVEMHIYPQGGHGWGFSSEKYKGKGNDVFGYAREDFYNSLDRWLKSQSQTQTDSLDKR